MLTFIKLGGSLITDKKTEKAFREPVVRRLAGEIQAALSAAPDLQLLVGHGSGSFGHFAANRYHTMDGVHSREDWRGFAEVATVAAELNYLVAGVFQAVGIPVWRIQPSASAISHDGTITQMALEPLWQALTKGLVPLVYGDVSLDDLRGGTIISTETIFLYLAQHLPVDQLLLLGEVDGVYDPNGRLIPEITTGNFNAIEPALIGASGVDVTGGMLAKVQSMLSLGTSSSLTIRILNGTQPGLLQQTLLGQAQPGTVIRAETSG